MGNKVLDKVLSFIGFEKDDVDDYYDSEPEEHTSDWQEMKRNRKANVVSLQSAQQPVKMVFLKPRTFDEVQDIANNLKNRRPVILNLESTDKEVAQRIVDFLSGSTYALGGSMQKLSAAIFLFMPQNIDISGHFDEETSEKNIFSFMNNFSG
ncbi:cell division protein SepF [Metallumcola ferriviriculae]|uniref:Cell division protein SepF n=1 Tax=Metallumcola ferriviriculae TaxID=3039180 RepID=A0AAU0UN33_9FIRM|nr:cell division protein SepF [Desulfitibacteraceae bacterium MK1]